MQDFAKKYLISDKRRQKDKNNKLGF